MRNLYPNEVRETHPEKYFTDDIHAYVAEFDVRVALASQCAHSFQNCVLGLLRVVELGFCPPLAREARCVPVSSHCRILLARVRIIARAGKFIVSASCCSICQKFWHFTKEFDMSDEAKSHHLHAANALLCALGEHAIALHAVQLSGAKTPSDVAHLESHLSASLANTFRNYADGFIRKG